ncbi:MAG: major capsid protein [Gammaproteobacteria bacterium]
MNAAIKYSFFAALAVAALMFGTGPGDPMLDPTTASLGLLAVGQMSPGQVRVIDPILSNVARGYRDPNRIANMLFPRVPVQVSGGQIIEFGKEAFRRYNMRRTPGANTLRVQLGYLGKPFALVQDSLEGKVPFEHQRDASRVPGVDMGSRAVRTVMSIIERGLEIDAAEVALDSNNYDASHVDTLTGTDQWSDDGSNPGQQIRDYKEVIRSSIGVNPNTLMLGQTVFNAAAEHPTIKEQFKYTSADSITAEMLMRYFQVERLAIGQEIYWDDDNETMVDVWGDFALLAYVPANASSNEEPSYGYTYMMEGHPIVEEPYQDRNAKSWIYPTTLERSPEIVGKDAGFLIQDLVA